MKSDELRELARLHSIQLSYEDAAGKKRLASRDALAAILKTRVGDVPFDDALRARRDELACRVVEPVTVIWGRRSPLVPLHPRREIGRIEYDLTLESGDRFAGRIDGGLPGTRDGRLEQSLCVPHKLPYGYHKLRLTIDGATHQTLLMVAPLRAPAAGAGRAAATAHASRSGGSGSLLEFPRDAGRAAPDRSWGVFLPLYAARTRRSWGVGDLGDLEAFGEWINGFGGGIVATLPMLAAFEDEPSPYSPVSRLYWNELYLDVQRLPEFDPADADAASIAELNAAEYVDYAAVNALKRRVLERMSERFTPAADFEEFASRASDYAEFRSHKERDRRTAGDDDRPVGTHRYHLYVQYRMAQQMREVADRARRSGPGLYLDFPLGVNAGGYDAWRYRDHFAQGVSVGAPPDLFFTKGQNWGFPPLDPDAARGHHYDYFRACIRQHVEHAGILRIDHVMGLHRLYWIPAGAEAKDGVYVRYPDDELFAILTIEANRTGTAIVGEDLGTVPEYVPQAMARHGLRRMYVVQYEMKPDGEEPAGTPQAASMASVNTHDMPTFAGFWRGKDIDDRVQQQLLDEQGAADERKKREEMRQALAAFLKARGLLGREVGNTLDGAAVTAVLQALLAQLAASDAEMVLVNLEDLWLETEPQNVPGVPERSWRHRLRVSLEDARDDATVMRILQTVDEYRRKGNGYSQEADERSRHTAR